MADNPETTGTEFKNVGKASTQFKPGQSGNPNGRPLGSRHKLAEAFIRALCDDFMEHGVEVIQKVREEKSDQYLRVIASLQPKELVLKDERIEDMDDADIVEMARQFKQARLAATKMIDVTPKSPPSRKVKRDGPAH